MVVNLTAQMRPLPKASDVPKLREDAAKGDAVALYQLAVCHNEEIGVSLDFKEALELATKAADKGDVPAMVMVSVMYGKDLGIKRDKVKSYEWAKKAAATEHPLGFVALANCARWGYGMEKSEAERIRLLKKAADLNNDFAIGELAVALFLNDSISRDYKEAVRLATLAETRKQRMGSFILSLAYFWGAGVEKDLVLSEKYALRTKSLGSPLGDVVMGTIMMERQSEDYPAIIALFQRGVKFEITRAMSFLGMLYLEGKGVPKSPTEAVNLWRRAAELGDEGAMHNYAMATLRGEGRIADIPLAVGIFQTAASLGSERSQSLIQAWDINLKQSADYKLGTLIAQSIKRQLDAGDIPNEFDKDFLSVEFDIAGHVQGKNKPVTKGVGYGTGLVFSNSGYCFTNFHVIDGATEVKIYVPATRKTHKATIHGKDKANDLAVLHIEDWKPFENAHPTPPPLATSIGVNIGERVFTIGFPIPIKEGLDSQEHKYTSGDISATSGISDDRSQFQISSPIQPGNSGGPLALSDGRIVGVIVSSLSGTRVQNVNFAIKIDYLKLLAIGSGIEIPQNLSPGPDPIDHVKAYTVQIISEK